MTEQESRSFARAWILLEHLAQFYNTPRDTASGA